MLAPTLAPGFLHLLLAASAPADVQEIGHRQALEDELRSTPQWLEWRVADGLPADWIQSIAQSRDGLLWLLTPEHLVSFDGLEFRPLRLTPVANDTPTRLWVDGVGRVHVVGRRGMWSLGVGGVRYRRGNIPADEEAPALEEVLAAEEPGGVGTLPPGSTAESVTAFLRDREGNLWIGTRRDGLKCGRPRAFVTLPLGSAEEASQEVYSLHQDGGGTIWAGSWQGELYRWEDEGFRRVILRTDPFDERMFMMAQDPAGLLLLGTEYRGLWTWSGDQPAPYLTVEGPVEGTITTVYSDARGRLWVGRYEEGLGFYEDGRFTPLLDQETFGGKMVFGILEDRRGNLWIGGNHGIVYLQGGDTDPHGMVRLLSETHVASLQEDDAGAIWASSPGVGLIRLDPETFQSVTFRSEEDLGCPGVYRLLNDDHGAFWITCGLGWLRIRQDDLAAFSSGEEDILPTAILGLSDGLEAVGYEGIKTRDGRLLLATDRGVAVLDPGALPLNTTPPGVMIHSARVAGRIQYRPAADPRGLEMESSSLLSLEVRAVTFRGTERLAYRYRMEGLEDHWTSTHTAGSLTVDYPDLDPGEYVFRVTAANNHGTWNEEGAALALVVHPTLFQSAAFRAFLAALLLFGMGGSGATLYRRRKRLQNKYGKYKVPDDDAQRCCRALTRALEKEEVYRNRELSLKSLAAHLDIPPHHLSQVINERFGKNFFQLINDHRIRAAKRLLMADGERDPKIITIAFDVGFNTLNSFNRAFKRHEGMTPTQFRKANRRD